MKIKLIFMQRKSKYEPNAGDIFGRLTVTGEVHYKECADGYKRRMIEAKCVCGDVRDYLFKYLIKGDTKSCGCYKRDMIAKALTKHNLSRHPLYSVYQDMKRRCYVKKCKAYPDYGGRGIKVCDEWLSNVKTFYDWALANGWEKGLELDRKENNGIYEPDNCHFVTRDVGNKNTRRVIMITAWGETKCAADWLRDRRCKIKGKTLTERLKTGKWNIEEAITTKPNANKKEVSQNIKTARMITAWGETKCISAWSEDKRCKIGYSGLKIRLNKGWMPEDAISETFRSK